MNTLAGDSMALLITLFVALFVALVLSQTVASFLKKIFETISHVFLRYFTTNIEIHAYYGMQTNVTSWINIFIEHKCGKNLGHFRITKDIYSSKSMSRRHGLHSVDEYKEYEDDSEDIKKQLEPLPTNWSVSFWYKKIYIRIIRSISEDIRGGQAVEVYKITAYGTVNKQLLIDMIEEARKMAEKKPAKHINYFRAELAMGHAMWRLVRRVQPRTLSSIVLRNGVTKTIEQDLEDFTESRQWYKERGIPYRRGYLLYGPPGCGKTSFIKAISGQIGYDIYEIQLSNQHLTDQNLNDLISRIGQKSILLFEDIDAVFAPRVQDEERSERHDVILGNLKIRQSTAGVTFSGLLNAIDGVASEEDYIVFMTTNCINKLDQALIRPGRIDMKQLIDYPDENQITTFFKKFYPDCNDELATKFAKAVNDLKCNPSIAQIQGVFLKHKKEPDGNLLDVASLVEVCKDNLDHRNLYV